MKKLLLSLVLISTASVFSMETGNYGDLGTQADYYEATTTTTTTND